MGTGGSWEHHPVEQNDALIWALAAIQIVANNIEISFQDQDVIGSELTSGLTLT